MDENVPQPGADRCGIAAREIEMEVADATAAKDAFVARLLSLYQKPDRMHPITGQDGAPLVGDELRAALADEAESIRFGDTSGTIGGVGKALKNKSMSPRVIGRAIPADAGEPWPRRRSCL